jgi:CRP/FNR family transcriptional regulator
MASIIHTDCYCSALQPHEEIECGFAGPEVDPARAPDALTYVRQLPLFAGLSKESQRELADSMRVREYVAGEVLVEAGSPCTELLILRSGRARAVRSRGAVWDQTVTEFGSGFPVNVAPILEGAGSSVTVLASQEGSLISIPSGLFMRKVDEDAGMARQLLQCAARHFRVAAGLSADLSLLSLKERLIRFLLDRAPERGAGGPPTRPWDLSHAELAKRLGGSREEVTRALGSLKKKGLIDVGFRFVEILDRAGLERMAPVLYEKTAV